MFLKRLKDAESAVLVNGSILIKLLSRSFSYQARIRNEFDINLDALAGVFHLFVGLREAGRKILCKRFSTKSRVALESRVDSGLDPLVTESHGGQSGMRAGTA